jgi:hypothetical protein
MTDWGLSVSDDGTQGNQNENHQDDITMELE